MSDSAAARQERQERLFSFPYHYIPHERDGVWHVSRSLHWGFEYLAVLETVLDIVRSGTPDSVLDFGCGDGRLLYELLRCTSIPRLVGIDISKRALTLAAAQLDVSGEGRVRLHDSPEGITEGFDVITSMETFEHIPDEELPQVLQRLHGLLRNDGRLIVTVPTTNLRLNPKHFRHYSLPLLTEQVEGLFEVSAVLYVHRLGRGVSAIRRMLHNRLFTMESKLVLRAMTRLYQRRYMRADAETGAHLIALLTKS